ncbi:hypothetical protein ScPMuIL_012332 [Solemya velum]
MSATHSRVKLADGKMADFPSRLSPTCLEDIEEEILDPRIQVELERLNKASEEINQLELELDDARAAFRQSLSDATHKLNGLAKKLGVCVEKARPYYDSRMKAKEAHIETQKAALRFERACSMHEAAKEMVQLAEQGYMKREEPSDPAWQEMLNHATMKVNESEKERMESEEEHRKMTDNFKETENRVQKLQKDLKRAINKSRPYFEMKIKFNQMMDEQKRCVSILEEDVTSAKKMYAEALRNLESISDEIHQQRVEKRLKEELGVRGAGVGSESPSPPPFREKGTTIFIDGSSIPHTSSCSTASTTCTTSGWNDSSHSDSETFTLPSVIYSSPESARRRSYRNAIESRQSQSLDLNSVMEECEDLLSLDEEYMPLPNTRHPKAPPRRTRNRSESEISSVDSRTDDEDIFSGTVVLDISTGSSQNRSQTDSDRNDTSTSDSLSCSPSGRREANKLQGLILKIDQSMDPITQYSRRVKQVSAKSCNSKNNKTESPASQARPASYPYKRSVTVPVDTHPLQEMNHRRTLQSPTSSVMSDLSESRESERGSLKLQSGAETDEMSDSDSIVSAGQMLDDDQVGILTLDFSDDLSNRRSFQRQEWSRMSLPPRLSYLENYFKHRTQMQRTHAEPSKDDKNSQIETNTNATVTPP